MMKYFYLALIFAVDILAMFAAVVILLASTQYPYVFWGTVVVASIIFVLLDYIRDKVKAIYQ